jgi:hypothetical protein
MTPEQAFAVAILRLAWADLRSRCPSRRADAVRFWMSPAVAWWEDLLNLDGGLQRRAAALRRHADLEALPCQLSLWEDWGGCGQGDVTLLRTFRSNRLSK